MNSPRWNLRILKGKHTREISNLESPGVGQNVERTGRDLRTPGALAPVTFLPLVEDELEALRGKGADGHVRWSEYLPKMTSGELEHLKSRFRDDIGFTSALLACSDRINGPMRAWYRTLPAHVKTSPLVIRHLASAYVRSDRERAVVSQIQREETDLERLEAIVYGFVDATKISSRSAAITAAYLLQRRNDMTGIPVGVASLLISSSGSAKEANKWYHASEKKPEALLALANFLSSRDQFTDLHKSIEAFKTREAQSPPPKGSSIFDNYELMLRMVELYTAKSEKNLLTESLVNFRTLENPEWFQSLFERYLRAALKYEVKSELPDTIMTILRGVLMERMGRRRDPTELLKIMLNASEFNPEFQLAVVDSMILSQLKIPREFLVRHLKLRCDDGGGIEMVVAAAELVLEEKIEVDPMTMRALIRILSTAGKVGDANMIRKMIKEVFNSAYVDTAMMEGIQMMDIANRDVDGSFMTLQICRDLRVPISEQMYTNMMKTLLSTEKISEVTDVLASMERDGFRPTAEQYELLVGALVKSRNLPEALRKLKEMERNNLARNTSLDMALVIELVRSGNVVKALPLLKNLVRSGLELESRGFVESVYALVMHLQRHTDGHTEELKLILAQLSEQRNVREEEVEDDDRGEYEPIEEDEEAPSAAHTASGVAGEDNLNDSELLNGSMEEDYHSDGEEVSLLEQRDYAPSEEEAEKLPLDREEDPASHGLGRTFTLREGKTGDGLPFKTSYEPDLNRKIRNASLNKRIDLQRAGPNAKMIRTLMRHGLHDDAVTVLRCMAFRGNIPFTEEVQQMMRDLSHRHIQYPPNRTLLRKLIARERDREAAFQLPALSDISLSLSPASPSGLQLEANSTTSSAPQNHNSSSIRLPRKSSDRMESDQSSAADHD
ncbi:hypothetical protein NDN08_005893 [Rhodosorus marinus]|uniref:Pentacotripeptide-repeat region of PRORP domain-containing protein n=1 Tax=Rhodosorus marinus TaxID=101924 RepID=A0AAV8V2X2_9RHOD|nr:hypothetical protein NDN08_005893 [Rhodosorus marinus]